MDRNHKAQEARIKKVFPEGVDEEKCEETIKIYKEYLEKNLEFPVTLTGIEDFNWEEFYIFNPQFNDEYKELKKTQPSYTDTYQLIKIPDKIDEYCGLYAKVRRISDKKIFELPLADLKEVNKKSENYQILDDYAVWVVNY